MTTRQRRGLSAEDYQYIYECAERFKYKYAMPFSIAVKVVEDAWARNVAADPNTPYSIMCREAESQVVEFGWRFRR